MIVMKTDFKEDIPAHESPEMIKLISELSVDERAVRFFNFWNFTRELQWAGIKMRNPELSDLEVDDKFRSMMMDFYKKESEK